MNNKILIIGGLVAIIAAIGVMSTAFVIRETEQALVLRFGEAQRAPIQEPGLHFKAPFIDQVVIFDKRNLDFDAPAEEIPTVDQKQLVVDAFARYQITNPLMFFQTVNNETGARARISSIISSNLRQTLGRVPLTRVLTEERASLMQEIADNVNREASSFGIQVVDVRLKRVDLPEENSQAIFRRMQTQREQEARKIRAEGDREGVLIRADADKNARVTLADAQRQSEILRGEGEAQAEQTYRLAYGENEAFFDFYRSLEAVRRAAQSDTTSYVGPASADLMRLFDQTDPPLSAPSGALTRPNTSSLAIPSAPVE